MKVEYNYNRESFVLIPEQDDVKKLIDIKSRGRYERQSESLFIEEFLTKMGFSEIKEAPIEAPTLFNNSGPLIMDNISKMAYIFERWPYCDFISKLINMEKVTWDKL